MFQGIQFEEHFIIIIAAVHNKSSFTKHGTGPFDSGEGDVVNGSKIFFAGRMEFRKNTDRMAVICEYCGFCDMIAFFKNIFCSSTFRTITNPSKRFEFVTFRFDNIRVINEDDRLLRTPLFHQGKISFESFLGRAFSKMSRKAVNDIDLSGEFMERMGDLSKQAAPRSEHTINSCRQ